MDTESLQRGIDHTRVNQRFLKSVGEEAINSSARIIQQVSDTLQIPEEEVIRRIKTLKYRTFHNMETVTREVLNVLLKVEDTHNYLDDFAKEKRDRTNKVII